MKQPPHIKNSIESLVVVESIKESSNQKGLVATALAVSFPGQSSEAVMTSLEEGDRARRLVSDHTADKQPHMARAKAYVEPTPCSVLL